MRNTSLLIMFIGMFILASSMQAGTYVPWDELTEASWIDFGDASVWPSMYPVNGGSVGIAESYPVAFSPAGGANKAKGMNALKFRHAGQTTGHIVSSDQAGVFEIVNTGKDNVFTDLLVLVAIDAESGSLEDRFEMTLNPETAEAFAFDPNHFGFYDNPFGRPSGYYLTTEPADPHSTDPPGEPIAYAFDRAMVTLYAVEGLTEPLPSIYHTNRAFTDANDSKSNPVSTFAVTVPGDINRDLRVDFADLAELAENWMIGTK